MLLSIVRKAKTLRQDISYQLPENILLQEKEWTDAKDH